MRPKKHADRQRQQPQTDINGLLIERAHGRGCVGLVIESVHGLWSIMVGTHSHTNAHTESTTSKTYCMYVYVSVWMHASFVGAVINTHTQSRTILYIHRGTCTRNRRLYTRDLARGAIINNTTWPWQCLNQCLRAARLIWVCECRWKTGTQPHVNTHWIQHDREHPRCVFFVSRWRWERFASNHCDSDID